MKQESGDSVSCGIVEVCDRAGEETAESLRRPFYLRVMSSTACPNCGLIFSSSTAVLKHMNHRYSSCHLWFTNTQPESPPRAPLSETHTPPPSHHFSDTPPPSHYFPHTPPLSHYFPHAGHVFDSGPGFLGWFRSDEDAEARSINPYYPFASKGEWELAGFLLRSGLSMKLINEFLSLSLVSFPQTPKWRVFDQLPDN